jgi:cytochrome c oxidase cbb3-type subunit 3
MPRGFWLIAAAVAGLAACDRETRPLASQAEATPNLVAVSDLHPGGGPPPPADPRARAYEGNAFQISQGGKYYRWFNCSGCHANGGGSIGPPLMDAKWRYGGQIEQIVATIDQGRPNGMPSFHGKIPEQQMWQIAAFVRSLSGNADKLAAPSRREAPRSIPPLNNIDKAPPKGGDTPGAGR